MGVGQWFGLGNNLAEPIKAIGDLYTTDKARIEAETKFEEVAQKPALSQLSINALLAGSSSWFNSGWQPLIGWTSGACVALYWIPQLLVANYIWGAECFANGTVTKFPIAPDDIYNLIWLLFGFGGYSLIKNKMGKPG